MISVIVPVYNTEKFLDKCIESILNQNFTDFEVILVNDGSSDSSGHICDTWAQKDARVKVIHKQNAGVSAARNTGISSAEGDYIAFVDSDDTVSPDYLPLLYKNIEGHDISIGTIQQDFVKDNRSVLLDVKNKSFTLSAFKKNMRLTLKNQYISSPVNKLFRKDIICNNGLHFEEDMNVGEDYVFCMSYYQHCQKIKCFSDIIYYYNVHQNYVRSENYIASRFADRVKMCGKLAEFYRQNTPYYYKRIVSEYMYTAYYETIDNKQITNHGQFIANYIKQNNLNDLIKKANYNIFDKKVFFKLSCEMLDKSYKTEVLKV